MSRSATVRLLGIYIVAGILTTLAFYWDEAWHTDKGRDSFWIPAHQMLYGSVAALLGVVLVWAVLLGGRGVAPRDIARHWPLALAFTGAAVTLLDAPIDGIWHNVFGRDAVFWSPPHVLAVAGLTTAAAGMLLRASALRGRVGAGLTVMTAALVMAALVVLVMEYDSDVPQFATLWYLPVLALTATFTFALAGAVSPLRWIGTLTALAYTGVMAGVVVFLSLLGHSTPILPALLIPGLAYDLTRRSGWPLPARAGAIAGALYLAYTPYLNLLLGGVRIEARDVLLGLPLSVALSWGIVWLMDDRRARPHPALQPAAAAAIILAITLASLPNPVLAHDPGQGPEVGYAELRATRQAGLVTVSALVTEPDPCSVFGARGLVARRARQEVRAPLQQTGACAFGGQIDLPERGRWFIYLELDHAGEQVEVWLPVIAGDGSAAYGKRSWIYVPPTRTVNAVAVGGGILIYAASLALFGACMLGFRRTRTRRAAGLLDPAEQPVPPFLPVSSIPAT